MLQARAEALGLALAAVAVIIPTVEQRLNELQPGKGRPAAASLTTGSSSLLAIAEGLSPAARQVSCWREMLQLGTGERAPLMALMLQDAAWISFALLRNTNTSCIIVGVGDKVLLARGAFATSAVAGKSSEDALEALSEVGCLLCLEQSVADS